jgi:hypothetical protein
MIKLRMAKKYGYAVCQVWQTEKILNVFGMKNCKKKMLGRYEIRWKGNDTIGLDGLIGCGPDSSGSG